MHLQATTADAAALQRPCPLQRSGYLETSVNGCNGCDFFSHGSLATAPPFSGAILDHNYNALKSVIQHTLKFSH
jgi:hypothetical protein